MQVTVDNTTTLAYTLVTVACQDRKGLLYDLLRTLKDVHVRVAYAKLALRVPGAFEADLFLQEAEGQLINDRCVATLLFEGLSYVQAAVLGPLTRALTAQCSTPRGYGS